MRHVGLVLVCTVALLASTLLDRRSSSAGLTTSARSGRIQQDVPIKADQSIVIDAQRSVVWALLSDIDRWPLWNPDIAAAKLEGPVAPGGVFGWSAGDTRVSATLALVEPEAALAWTGEAVGLKAVHVWTLSIQGDGRVLVRTRESMSSFPSSLFYSSAALAETNKRWLAALKRAAEAATRGGGSARGETLRRVHR